MDIEGNRRALASFLDCWKREKLIQISHVSKAVFSARIRYRWLTNDLRGKQDVSISLTGYDAFSIEIQEGGPFSAETLHLGFKCEFGRIRRTKESRALSITGCSSKLGGTYRVRIKPVARR